MTVVHDLLLIAHAGSGSIALLLGPVALAVRVRARRLPRSGRPGSTDYWWSLVSRLSEGYVAATLAVAATAVGLTAVAGTRLLWLLPMAAGTATLVLIGRTADRRTARGQQVPRWRIVHGYGGSYLAQVTALLVVAVGDRSPAMQIMAWVLPTAIGLPLILRAHRPPVPTRPAARLHPGAPVAIAVEVSPAERVSLSGPADR